MRRLLVALLLISSPLFAQVATPVKSDRTFASTTAWTSATSSNTTLAQSVAGYSTVSISLNATSTMTGGVLTFEVSDDGSTWYPVQGIRSGTTTLETTHTLAVESLLWQFNVAGYTNFRVRLSTVITGSGTASLRLQASNAVLAPVVTVQGTTTCNAGSGTFVVGDGAGALNTIVDSGSLTCNAGTNLNTSSLLLDATYTGRMPAGASPADNESNTITSLSRLGVFHFIYDGTTWDRVLEAANALNSTGGGIPTAQIIAQFDDTSPTAITENQFGNLRMSANRNMFGTIRDAAGNERGANVSAAFSLHVNLAEIAGATTSTAASGVQKVGVVGNAGATVDGTATAGTSPTNQVLIGQRYNVTAPAPTDGQTMAVQADQAGNQRVAPGIALTTLAGWTSGTSVNATQNIFTNSGTGAVLLHLVQGTTISAGAITFEVSYDNTNWVTIPADAVLDPASTTFAQITVPYTLVASTNKPFLLMGKGWQGLRIKLSTAITGSATVTPNYALLSNEPLKSVLALSPTAANLNSNVSQATAANLNARADTSGATGAAPPARADYVGGIGSGATGGFLIGLPVCDTFVPINISTATTTLIVTGVSGRHVYICSLSLVTAAANNVAMIAGTGATCGTSSAGMAGGTTSASGYNFAANGGIALGSGIGAVNRTETTGDSVCIVTSATTQLSGSFSYVIY